jgi:predicted nucleic acid-binding protein
LIYLDSSVALAHIFAESRRPPESLWSKDLISSRLLEYEIWNRVHARHLAPSHGDDGRVLLTRVSLVELSPPVLARALEPFPAPVRTIDALHLSTALFAISEGQKLELATYDARMLEAAKALKIPTVAL